MVASKSSCSRTRQARGRRRAKESAKNSRFDFDLLHARGDSQHVGLISRLKSSAAVLGGYSLSVATKRAHSACRDNVFVERDVTLGEPSRRERPRRVITR